MSIWKRLSDALRNEQDSYLIGDTVEIMRKIETAPSSVNKRRLHRLSVLLEKYSQGHELSRKEISDVLFLLMTVQSTFRRLEKDTHLEARKAKGYFFNTDKK